MGLYLPGPGRKNEPSPFRQCAAARAGTLTDVRPLSRRANHPFGIMSESCGRLTKNVGVNGDGTAFPRQSAERGSIRGRQSCGGTLVCLSRPRGTGSDSEKPLSAIERFRTDCLVTLP